MRSDDDMLDLERHVPTTAEDIVMLRRLRCDVRHWYLLSVAEIDAMLPVDALDRRLPTAAGARPVVLP